MTVIPSPEISSVRLCMFTMTQPLSVISIDLFFEMCLNGFTFAVDKGILMITDLFLGVSNGSSLKILLASFFCGGTDLGRSNLPSLVALIGLDCGEIKFSVYS